jgi:hypothetical protein
VEQPPLYCYLRLQVFRLSLVVLTILDFFMQFCTHKVIYRRYARLFFSICVDITNNQLVYLECIHLFVKILDHFSNVCELDLVFTFNKVIWERLLQNLLLRLTPLSRGQDCFYDQRSFININLLFILFALGLHDI